MSAVGERLKKVIVSRVSKALSDPDLLASERDEILTIYKRVVAAIEGSQEPPVSRLMSWPPRGTKDPNNYDRYRQ